MSQGTNAARAVNRMKRNLDAGGVPTTAEGLAGIMVGAAKIHPQNHPQHADNVHRLVAMHAGLNIFLQLNTTKSE